jgi:uncharacterized protein (TIGR04222 family)
MSEPWGISGPTFLWLYLALLAAPAVLGAVWTAAVRRAPAPAGGGDNRLPAIYHVAYPAGDPGRVVEAALANLVQHEQLRVESSGGLRATGAATTDPLEHYMVATVNSELGLNGRRVGSLTRGCAAMHAIAGDLEDRSLAIAPGRLLTVRRTVLALHIAVLVVGAVRWLAGFPLNRPVGLLTALLVGCVVAILVAWNRVRHRPRSVATSAGERLLHEIRTEQARAQGIPRGGRAPSHGALLAGAAGAVALGGLATHPDEELSAVPMPIGSDLGGGSSGGGTYCGGSSSCGSGGGGGGCGG